MDISQRMLNPELGEAAVAIRESHNYHDRYAVAILENECVPLVMFSRDLEESGRALHFVRSVTHGLPSPRFGRFRGGSIEFFERMGSDPSALQRTGSASHASYGDLIHSNYAS